MLFPGASALLLTGMKLLIQELNMLMETKMMKKKWRNAGALAAYIAGILILMMCGSVLLSGTIPGRTSQHARHDTPTFLAPCSHPELCIP